MDNTEPSGRPQFLIPFILALLGGVAFAALFFLTPRTYTQTNLVTQIVTNNVILTNTVIKEVPKEVEKIVNVPADIPRDYLIAMNIYRSMTNAATVSHDGVLFNMTNIATSFFIADDIKTIIPEDEVKAKFELTLRRNNIPIDSKSDHTVSLAINGFYSDEYKSTIIYNITCQVIENQFIFRNAEARWTPVQVWSTTMNYGYAGKQKIASVVLDDVEKQAEIFANDFLAANPKK